MFRHWPADRRTSMSVPGARWPTSRGAPSTRRHSPSGTLSSSRGIRPGKVTDYWVEQRFFFLFYKYDKKCRINETTGTLPRTGSPTARAGMRTRAVVWPLLPDVPLFVPGTQWFFFLLRLLWRSFFDFVYRFYFLHLNNCFTAGKRNTF